MQKLTVGDRVMFSKHFLRSTGQTTGEVPFAEGTIISICSFGKHSTMLMAYVNWNNPNIPNKINLNNLVRMGTLEID